MFTAWILLMLKLKLKSTTAAMTIDEIRMLRRCDGDNAKFAIFIAHAIISLSVKYQYSV